MIYDRVTLTSSQLATILTNPDKELSSIPFDLLYKIYPNI